MEDYKQKYEEALERAKVVNPGTTDYNIVTKIFPELKESDDERIRKELIDFVKSRLAGFPEYDRFIAWLEKHGEQKPADKVESKFKVGDWIVTTYGKTHCIEKIKNNKVYVLHGGCIPIEDIDHIWTIQDAKDGDILTDKQNCTCIFREIMTDDDEETSVDAYCGININNKFVTNEKGEVWTVPEDLFPATKEQRNILFYKMNEAGCEWDAEKRELKRIEQEQTSKQTNQQL